MRNRETSISKITRPNKVDILIRERLFHLIDSKRKCPILWLVSPAGSGKTTLVSSYLKEQQISNLWYQMDKGDGDIASFFYYMGLASRKAAPSPGLPL